MEETGAETPPPAEVADPLLAAILRDLKPQAEEPPAAEAAPEPTEPPPAETPTQETPPPAPAATAKPAKKGFKSAKGNAVVDAPPPTPPPVPEPPQPPPQPQPQAAPLTDEQREELEEAEVAARLFPDRYKDYPAQLKRWNSEFETRARALLEKNPNITEEDDEYQALLRTKPTMKAVDSKRVQRTIGEEAAVRATEKRLAPKINKIEMDSRRATIMPEVQAFATNGFQQQIREVIQADARSPLTEPLKVFLEKGAEAVEKEFPMEINIFREVAAASQARVREFLLLRNEAVEYDPAKNPLHQQIADFINFEGQEFENKGGKYLVQNGRRFMPRSEFLQMLNRDASEARTFDRQNWRTSKYWTFTDAAIVDMMAIRTKQAAENRIAEEEQRAKRYGFARPPKQAAAQAQPKPTSQPTSIQPPKARPAAAPGAASTPKTPPPTDDSPIPLSGLVSHLKMKK